MAGFEAPWELMGAHRRGKGEGEGEEGRGGAHGVACCCYRALYSCVGVAVWSLFLLACACVREKGNRERKEKRRKEKKEKRRKGKKKKKYGKFSKLENF
jgi:hypothetical protein